MPKLPEDIIERSKSTQIQWLIILFMWASALLFIIVSGIVYIINQFTNINFEISDTFWIFMVAIILVTYNTFKNFKKQYVKITEEVPESKLASIFSGRNPSDFVDEVLDEVAKKIQKDLDAIDDNIYRKAIVLEYLQKSRVIIVELETDKELDEEEIEKAFEKILDENFSGLVISAKAATND
jgi:hypothetical protein